MISETTLMDCENIPEEMCRFDEPWHFVGEVQSGRPYLDIICGKCSPRPAIKVLADLDPSFISFVKVSLRGYPFVTDDMIEVVVYFGICGDCDSAYWARQGPPFTRARCLEGVTS